MYKLSKKIAVSLKLDSLDRVNLNSIFEELSDLLTSPPSEATTLRLKEYSTLLCTHTCTFDPNQGLSLEDMFQCCTQVIPKDQGIRVEILPQETPITSLEDLLGQRLSILGSPIKKTVYIHRGTESTLCGTDSAKLHREIKIKRASQEPQPNGTFQVQVDSPTSRRRHSSIDLKLAPQICWMSQHGIFQKCEPLGQGSYSKLFTAKPLIDTPQFNKEDTVVIRKRHSKPPRGETVMQSQVTEFTATLRTRHGGSIPDEIYTLLNLPFFIPLNTVGRRVKDQVVSVHRRADSLALAAIKKAEEPSPPDLLLNQLVDDIFAALSIIHSLNFIHGDIKPDNLGWFESQGRRFGLLDMDSIKPQSSQSYTFTAGYLRPNVEDGSIASSNHDFIALALSYVEIGTNAALPKGCEPIPIQNINQFLVAFQEGSKTLADIKLKLTHTKAESLPSRDRPIFEFIKRFSESTHPNTEHLFKYLFNLPLP